MATPSAALVVLKSIGTSPFTSDGGGGDTPVVGGEDTDEVVTQWPFGFMVTAAIAAICSGSTCHLVPDYFSSTTI